MKNKKLLVLSIATLMTLGIAVGCGPTKETSENPTNNDTPTVEPSSPASEAPATSEAKPTSETKPSSEAPATSEAKPSSEAPSLPPEPSSDAPVADPEYTNTGVDIEVKDGKVYLVFTGTYANVTEAEVLALQPKFDAQDLGWSQTADGKDDWGGSWAYEGKESAIDVSAANGVWTAKVEATDFSKNAHTLHFSLEGKVNPSTGNNANECVDFKITDAIDKTVETDDATYRLSCVPGSTKPGEFWGCVGLTIAAKAVEPPAHEHAYASIKTDETFEVMKCADDDSAYMALPSQVTGKWSKAGDSWTYKISVGEAMTARMQLMGNVTANGGKKIICDTETGADDFETANNGQERISLSVNGVAAPATDKTYQEMGILDSTGTRHYFDYATIELQAGINEITITVPANAGYRIDLGGEVRFYVDKYVKGPAIEKEPEPEIIPDVEAKVGEVVRFEAEKATNGINGGKAWYSSGFTTSSQFVGEDASASDGKFVTGSTGAESNSGVMGFTVKAPEDGKMTFTVAYSQGSNKASKTMPMAQVYNVALDGTTMEITSEVNTLNPITADPFAYNWVEITYTATVTAGVHTLTLGTMTGVQNLNCGCPCIDYFDIEMPVEKPVERQHNEIKSYVLPVNSSKDFFKAATWYSGLYNDTTAKTVEEIIDEEGNIEFEQGESGRMDLFQVAAKGTGWSHLADKKANSDAATDFPYGTTWSYEMDIKATGAFTMLLHGTSKASADGLTYVTSGSNETAVQNGVYLDFGADGSITLRHRCAGNNVGQHPEYESINEVAAAAGSFALNETVKLRIDINRVNDSELTTVLYVNDVAVKLEGTFADTTCFELLENGGYDYKNVLLTNGYGQRFGISATGGTVTISSMNITSQAPAAEEVPETPAE